MARALAATLLLGILSQEAIAATFSGDGITKIPLMRAEGKHQVEVPSEAEEPAEALTESDEQEYQTDNMTALALQLRLEGEEAEKAGYAMSTSIHYRRRRVLRPGMIVAFHNHIHKRYIRSHGWKLDSSGLVAKKWYLPDTWTWERWTVVAASRRRGAVALHNPKWNRFMKMWGHRMMQSPVRNDYQLPWNWVCERFLPRELGGGKIGLWSPHWKRWARMRGTWMDSSPVKGYWHIPAGWTWERFTVIEHNQLVRPGMIVALHNRVHRRFLRMHGHYTDSSALRNWNQLPAGWTWERFTVVDAGNGEIALWNHIHKRYVKLGGASPYRNSLVLPSGWHSEKWSVINAGNGEVALHNNWHNRYLRMNRARIDYSPKRSATTLPWGWTWERFRPVKVGTNPLILQQTEEAEMAELLASFRAEGVQNATDNETTETESTTPSTVLPEPEAEPGYKGTLDETDELTTETDTATVTPDMDPPFPDEPEKDLAAAEKALAAREAAQKQAEEAASQQ